MIVSSLEAQVGPPPIITKQPESQTAVQGTDAVFSIEVLSSTQVRYKWFFNGQNAGNGFGNGTPVYTVTNVQPDDAGIYYVEVKNSTGRILSSNAVLTVVAPTGLACFSPQMTSTGFSFQISGPAGLDYVVQTSSNLTSWLPISTNPAPDGIVFFTDATATNEMGFYRVKLVNAAANLNNPGTATDSTDSTTVTVLEESGNPKSKK